MLFARQDPLNYELQRKKWSKELDVIDIIYLSVYEQDKT